MSNLKHIAVAGGIVLGACAALGWTGDVCGQKFIGHGWDLMKVDPQEVLDHADLRCAEKSRAGTSGGIRF